MPPLLADFIHARACKPICEKYLTLPAFLPMVFGLFVSLACILLISLIDRRASGRIGQDP